VEEVLAVIHIVRLAIFYNNYVMATTTDSQRMDIIIQLQPLLFKS